MKSYKMYKGQELAYDGQRYDLEEIRISDESSSIEVDPILQKVEAAKEKIKNMKEQQEEEEEILEIDPVEYAEEKLGFLMLGAFALMALYNMMKWGHI